MAAVTICDELQSRRDLLSSVSEIMKQQHAAAILTCSSAAKLWVFDSVIYFTGYSDGKECIDSTVLQCTLAVC